MPRDDRCSDAMRLNVLHRIADALEIPADALYGPQPALSESGGFVSQREVAAVLTAFLQIRDPDRRQACLDHVIALANDGERTTDR